MACTKKIGGMKGTVSASSLDLLIKPYDNIAAARLQGSPPASLLLFFNYKVSTDIYTVGECCVSSKSSDVQKSYD